MVQNLFPISSFFKIKFMFRHIFYAVLLFISATTTQCNKTSTNPDDSNSLPPETQTGAGTFACKINGVVWRYKDPNYEFLSTKPKTRWEFDPNMYGGYLYIAGDRYLDGVFDNDILILAADSLLSKRDKSVNKSFFLDYGMHYINFDSSSTKCNEYYTSTLLDSTTNFFSSGKIFITKLDQSTKIISGTFYCTIKQNGCDTLKITEGRFDLKY